MTGTERIIGKVRRPEGMGEWVKGVIAPILALAGLIWVAAQNQEKVEDHINSPGHAAVTAELQLVKDEIRDLKWSMKLLRIQFGLPDVGTRADLGKD